MLHRLDDAAPGRKFHREIVDVEQRLRGHGAISAREAGPLAPPLRGEGWGEGPLSAIAGESGVRGESPSPAAQERGDLSPQAGRGKKVRDLLSTRPSHVLRCGSTMSRKPSP